MPKFNMCRDGFLASAMISSSKNKLIEECLHLSSRYKQIRSKIYTAAGPDVHNKVFEKLNEVLKSRSSQLLTIDGVKAILDDNSWVLLRSCQIRKMLYGSRLNQSQNMHVPYTRNSKKESKVYMTKLNEAEVVDLFVRLKRDNFTSEDKG